MTDAAVADDPRYRQLFDVSNQLIHKGQIVGDLNAEFNALREQAPVLKGSLRQLAGLPGEDHHWANTRDRYTCFSFKACSDAFRDNLTFSSQLYLESIGVQRMGTTLLEMVGAQHKCYRAVMQPTFLQPRTKTWWRQNWIDEIVDLLVSQLEGRDQVDLNFDICARLPMHVVSRAFGLSGETSLTFRTNLVTAVESIDADEEERGAAFRVVLGILQNVIAAKRKAPADDVISEIMQRDLTLSDGTVRKLTDTEVLANTQLILLAGGGTTWRQLGITLVALLSRPDQWRAAYENRALIDAAIEESLRWNPTDPVFSRLVTRDVELDGVMIPEGAMLDICLGAGNRDPQIWDNPDDYDIFRKKHHHLGFSIGPHQCLGRDVARVEMSVAINRLMDRFPELRLDPEAPPPQLKGGLDQRGMSAVPVVLR